MKILYRDRINGISTSTAPMTTYGPGNMLDDSNRNQWISSGIEDTITVDCLNQVDSFFMGQTRADSAQYSFLRKAIADVSAITHANTVVTVTTTSDHGLYTGDRIRVTGASPSDYNVTATSITKTTTKIFTYTVSSGSTSGDVTGATIRAYHRDRSFDTTITSPEDQFRSTAMTITSMAPSAGSSTVTVTSNNHGLTTLDKIYVSIKTTSQLTTAGATSSQATDVRLMEVDGVPVTVTGTNIFTYVASGTFSSTPPTLTTTSNLTILEAVVSFKSYDGTGILYNTSFAVRYFASLSAFVQGQFINSSSAFTSLPYDDDTTSLELVLSSTIDRSAGEAENFLVDSLVGTSFTATVARHGYYCRLQSASISLIAGDLIHQTGETLSGLNGIFPLSSLSNADGSGSVTDTPVNGQGTGGYNYYSVPITAGSVGDNGSLTLVSELKGRFIRPPFTTVTYITFNAGSAAATFTHAGTVPVGTCIITFSSSHGLVNNDKIIVKGTGRLNLDGTHLVTYSSSTQVSFNVTQQSTLTVSNLTASAVGLATITTTAKHDLLVGEEILFTGMASNYNSVSTTQVSGYTVISTPTSTSFTVTSSSSQTASGGTIYRGVVEPESTYGTDKDVEFAYSSSSHIIAEPINIPDFKNVLVGGQVEFTMTERVSYFAQVRKITGDGTSENDIVLNGLALSSEVSTNTAKALPTGAGTQSDFNSIRLPVTAGILRAGFSLDFPNAKTGLKQAITDYSIRKELPTGSYYFLNRDTAREFSGSMTATPAQADNFIQVAESFMAEPFPALVLGDMNLDEKTAIYAYFKAMPNVTFSNKLDNIRELSFNLKEVL